MRGASATVRSSAARDDAARESGADAAVTVDRRGRSSGRPRSGTPSSRSTWKARSKRAVSARSRRTRLSICVDVLGERRESRVGEPLAAGARHLPLEHAPHRDQVVERATCRGRTPGRCGARRDRESSTSPVAEPSSHAPARRGRARAPRAASAPSRMTVRLNPNCSQSAGSVGRMSPSGASR